MSREPGMPERDRDASRDSDHGRDPAHLDPTPLDPTPLDQADEAFVRSVLARHADVGPMPSHVAERLAVALAAAEEAEDAAADTEERSSAGAVRALRRGVHPAAERRRLAHPVRLLVAAAVGVTVLASGISLTYLDGGTEGAATNTAGAAPQQPEADTGADVDTGADNEADTEAAAAEPDAAGPGRPGTTAGSDGPPSVTTSGRNYTAESLPAAASWLLSARDQASAPEPTAQSDRAARPTGPLVAPPAAELDRLRDVLALGLCARALFDGASEQVLAADLGRYQGQPAAVLVLPGPDPTVVDVWVVGPGCAPGDEQVLARERVPR